MKKTKAETVPIAQWMERYWYVLRSHRPSQLIWRAFNLAQRRVFPLLPKSRYTQVGGSLVRPRGNSGFDRILDRQLELRSGQCDINRQRGINRQGDANERVERLLRGEFCFLHETRQLGVHANVGLATVEPVSHLWRFHLHYQEYLLDILAACRAGTHPEAANRICRIVGTWMDANPLDRRGALGDAWHPFCLSRRIPVWLLLWHGGVIAEGLQDRFASSLESQVRYLEQHLEWDLRGNHLLENLKTLALASAFLDGPANDRRLQVAERNLEQQLVEQLLPSGEHFERSPMYHAQMLLALLDVRDVSESLAPKLAQACDEAVERMARFLEGVLHPDGQIPLLSDSAMEETPLPSLLIADARRNRGDGAAISPRDLAGVSSPPQAAVVGDYWTWRDGEDYLLLDAGPAGADELPAHAHCDLLSIEVSLKGQRFIVDSGVYDYADGDMRRYCRSTAAHNVLQVDGAEQCDLWSRFRMGRRGHPGPLLTGESREFRWACATHDAYQHVQAPVVGRWIACRPGGPWIVVDWAEGSGQHQLTDWLHLSPDVEAMLGRDHEVTLQSSAVAATLRCLMPAATTIETGWYCPDFGVKQEASVIRIEGTTTLPGAIVWTLDFGESGDGVDCEEGDGVTVGRAANGDVTLSFTDGEGTIDWFPMSLARGQEQASLS